MAVVQEIPRHNSDASHNDGKNVSGSEHGLLTAEEHAAVFSLMTDAIQNRQT